jgi:hypothetical protein
LNAPIKEVLMRLLLVALFYHSYGPIYNLEEDVSGRSLAREHRIPRNAELDSMIDISQYRSTCNRYISVHIKIELLRDSGSQICFEISILVFEDQKQVIAG